MITHTLALINDSLSSIAPSFANHLWQSTAFALAAWLVTLLLRSNAARVRYAIWLAASLKFLLPFSLLVSLGALLPRPQHVVATAPIDTAVDAVALPFSDNTIDIAPMAPHPTRTQVLMRSLPEALAVLWLAGALVVLTVWLARWRRISATRRRATPAHTGLELEILRRLQASTTAEIKASSFWRSQNLRIGLWNRRPLSAPTTIPLLLSPDLMEPGIVGILHPALLWPERLSSRLDDPHIEAILAHELMHVRRRDNLAAALHMLVETLFWFHPLVWYIERRMVEERERACDQAVVQLGSAPGIYADSLLKACRFCVESPLACVSGITGADLNRRVRSIMTLRLARLTLPRKLLLMSLALAAIAAPIAFGVLRAPVRIQAAAQSQTGDWMNAAGGKMSFDVAAVRQNKSGGQPTMNIDFGPGDNFHPTGGYFSGTNQALYTYILFAYKVSGFRELDTLLSQLPDWAKNDRFDIQARVTGDPTKDQLRLMMQSLLADRFKLVMHTEAREGPAYGLVLAKPGKPGPNLQPHSTKIRCSTAPPDNPTPGKEPAPLEAVAGGLPSVCGVIFPTMRPNVPGDAREVARDVTMRRIASEMSGWSTIDRPVIDQTGLNGTFDFTFEWTPEVTAGDNFPFASAPVAERIA